jgi:hypothetical protein
MYLRIMISLSLVVLAVALFVTPNASYQVFLQLLVCAAAALIVWNAVRDQVQYLWAVAFCGIARDRLQSDRSSHVPQPRVLRA